MSGVDSALLKCLRYTRHWWKRGEARVSRWQGRIARPRAAELRCIGACRWTKATFPDTALVSMSTGVVDDQCGREMANCGPTAASRCKRPIPSEKAPAEGQSRESESSRGRPPPGPTALSVWEPILQDLKYSEVVVSSVGGQNRRPLVRQHCRSKTAQILQTSRGCSSCTVGGDREPTPSARSTCTSLSNQAKMRFIISRTLRR